MPYRFAVELKPSQAKKLLPGCTCNVYAVSGDPRLFVYGGDSETFEVTGGKAKNAYLKLVPDKFGDAPVTVADFEPRPKAEAGWELVDGCWRYNRE